MTSYDAIFFDYVNAGSLRSARKLLPILIEQIDVSRVLDVGCGQGAWLAVWHELGVRETTGLDGDYVDVDRLLMPKNQFIARDLSSKFQLQQRYDLVQSLEVAEHLPVSSAAGFVASLVGHGDLILFSAAPKGQGGDGHINEQSYEYWRALFAEHGYIPIDYIRPNVLGMDQIEPWYRFNMMLYASPERFASLSQRVRSARVEGGIAIQDVSPRLYQLRKLIVRCLPVSVMTWIAKLKERITLMSRNAKDDLASS